MDEQQHLGLAEAPGPDECHRDEHHRRTRLNEETKPEPEEERADGASRHHHGDRIEPPLTGQRGPDLAHQQESEQDRSDAPDQLQERAKSIEERDTAEQSTDADQEVGEIPGVDRGHEHQHGGAEIREHQHQQRHRDRDRAGRDEPGQNEPHAGRGLGDRAGRQAPERRKQRMRSDSLGDPTHSRRREVSKASPHAGESAEEESQTGEDEGQLGEHGVDVIPSEEERRGAPRRGLVRVPPPDIRPVQGDAGVRVRS